MKRKYRSIAVTVLAALMALPMVVRAEDTKIVTTIYVTNPDAPALHRLYVGQSTADVLKEINKLEFKGEIPGGDLVDLKVTDVRLKGNNGGSVPQEVWPFKKADNGNIEVDSTKLPGRLELIFNFVETDKGYKFDANEKMQIKDHANNNGIAGVSKSGEGHDGSTRFTFEGVEVFRKFTFANDGDGTELKKRVKLIFSRRAKLNYC